MGEDSRASMAQEELRLVLGGGGLQSMAVDGQSAASREEPGGGGGSGAERLLVRSRPEVVANGLRQGTLKEKRLGSSRDGWGSGWGNKWQWQKDTEDKEEAVLDKATQEVIKSLVQLSLRHEAELGRLRADCGCSWTQSRPIRLRACKPRIKEMATEWSTQYAAGTVKSPLRNLLMLAVIKELRGRLTTFLQDEERCGKAISAGWMSQCIGPGMELLGMEPQGEATRKDRPAAYAQHGVAGPASAVGGDHHQGRGVAELPQHKGLGEGAGPGGDPLYDFMITVGLRTQEAHAAYRVFQLLSGNAVCKLIGARIRPERLARQPVAKQLEENYLSTPYCQ